MAKRQSPRVKGIERWLLVLHAQPGQIIRD
jgi:hypothetical protein